MKVQFETAPVCKSFQARYTASFDQYYRDITAMQLNDSALWSLLVRQFARKTDSGDNGWRGEFWGKLMRGACMVYSYTKDDDLYQTLMHAVLSLLTTQQITGRISSYLERGELTGWDVWCRKYVMLGLEHFYDICKDEKLKDRIVDSLKKHADYIMQHIGTGEGKKSILETSQMHGALNSVSIMQPYVRLYKMTGNEAYLQFANILADSQWQDNGIFDLAEKDVFAPFEYPHTKAYEMISCFEGLLELYEVCGEMRYLQTCIRFADKVLATDFTVIGGSGCHDEYFNNSTKTQIQPSDIHKQETCVTVTFMKYLSALYKHTKNNAYADAIEKSFFNAYLGALINQKNDYYLPVPMFYSYSPVYNNPRWTLMGGGKNIAPYAKCGCCVAIGAAGLDPFPQIGAILDEDKLVLNFFVAGEYHLTHQGQNLSFVLESNYPCEGNVKLTFGEWKQKGIILCVRKPSWCNSFTLLKGGRLVAVQEENGYLVLGEITCADMFELCFEMPIRLISSKSLHLDEENVCYIAKGPIVLCADGTKTDLDKAYRLKTDERGVLLYCQNADGGYTFECTNGEELQLKEYRVTGKNYYEPETISVWLKIEKEVL